MFFKQWTGGDLNDVRNMNLEDETIDICSRKAVYEARKKCFAMFLDLINGRIHIIHQG